MAYRVYEYGIISILAGSENLLIEQLHARHHYWNTLVGIEQAYQSAKETILLEGEQAVAVAHAAYQSAQEAVDLAFAARQRARQQTGTKRVPPEALTAARHARKEAYAQYKAARKAAFANPEIKERLVEAEQVRQVAVRRARADTNLYWGSYLDVEGNYTTQRRTLGARLKPHRPRPEGAVSVWLLSGGLPVDRIWGESSMIQLNPVPPEAWTSPVRGERRQRCKTAGRLRVGSVPGHPRQGLYVEFAVALHRPLPEGGIVRHASIVRRRVASHYQHYLTVTVEVPDAVSGTAGKPAAGLDLGWRLLPDGVRVGYLVDDCGREEDLRIPLRILDDLRKCDDIRSIRDQHFNAARRGLVAWLAEATGVPEWLREATRTLAHWRSPARLAALTLRWRGMAFAGDDWQYEALDEWRRRDKHLWEYEANLRQQAIAGRREWFRQIAADLCRRYGKLVMEDFDVSEMAQQESEADGSVRQYSAPGEFRLLLRQTAARAGVAVERVSAAYTTLMCHVCERRCAFDAGRELSHVCEWCGHAWDQDANAASNLLREWQSGELLADRA